MRKLLTLLLLVLALPAHAAITYIGASGAANNTNGGAISPGVDGSTTSGDAILCLVGQKNGADYTAITNSVGGYTRLIGITGSSGSTLTYWAKIAAASGNSPTFESTDTTAGRTIIGQCVTFRGTLNTVTGIVAHSATGSGAAAAAITTPALTVTTDNTVVLAGGIRANQWAAEDIAALSTMTEIGQPERTSSAQVAIKWDRVIQTTAANIASGSWTSTVNTAAYAAIVISIKPAASAPTFSVAPAIGTRTSSTIPVTATTACSDCTFYGVAQGDGVATPTCTQIKAGQDGTGTTAYKSFSQAMTASVQGTGTFSSYTDGTVRDGAFCLNSTAGGDSTVSTIANMYKVPAWTTAPSVTSQDDNDYTITKVLDGAGSCTVVACAKDTAAPTAAQTLAGNCTGDVAAIATVTDASCEAGTATLGGALTRPVHDVYVAATYGSQNSALTTLADECLDAPAGKTFVGGCPNGLTSVHANSPFVIFNAAATPDIVAGDIPVCDTAMTPNSLLDITWTAAGLFSYPGGDPSKQSYTCTFYDVSAGGMHADSWLGFVNNVAPTAYNAQYVADLIKDAAMLPVDFNVHFYDPDDATLTLTSSDTGTGTGTDKRPAGTSQTSGVWSGEPTSAGGSAGSWTETATDEAGDTATEDVLWTVREQVTVPNAVGGSLEDACGAGGSIPTVNLECSFSSSCSATVAALDVISQSPAAGAVVDPQTVVSLVVSSGLCGAGGYRRVRLGLGLGL